MEELTPEKIKAFQQTILQHYHEHGRSLPWRASSDPYHILISEIMLQQTQVQRVVAKYGEFVATFPDFSSLAQASLPEILRVWQGLGYNRRAMALQQTARWVVAEYDGKLPDSIETLRTFPGIGAATAGAIVAFAFNRPAVFIETNIRRVFLHFFFPGRNGVKDREILPLVEKTLDKTEPRSWYHALMDYGTMLKKLCQNPNKRSAHYNRQPPFRGSDREIRGMVLRTLLAKRALPAKDLCGEIGKSPGRVRRIISQLVTEGFLVREGNRLKISSGLE